MVLLAGAMVLTALACVDEYPRLKRKWATLDPPPAKQDTLSVRHVKFGLEEFEVESARFNILKLTGGTPALVLKVTTGACTRPGKTQEIATASPRFEVAVLLPPNDSGLTGGNTLTQPQGLDIQTQASLSHFFYLVHDSVWDPNLEIHSASLDVVDLLLTASVLVNGSLYSDPDAKLSLRAEFLLDQNLPIELDLSLPAKGHAMPNMRYSGPQLLSSRLHGASAVGNRAASSLAGLGPLGPLS